MKRIPFSKTDLKKLPDLAKRLLRGEQDYPLTNRDKLGEWMARICLYDTFADLQFQADKTEFPKPGSISRHDVRMLVASGLRKLTGMPLLHAYRRTMGAKLQILVIDQYTAEGMPGSNSATGQFVDAALMVKAGAPAFEFTVNRDGMAFRWERAYGLYQGVMSARTLSDIEPELKASIESEAGLYQYLSQELIPACWQPVKTEVEEGLEVPNHEVIWLFDEKGSYIARALRHTVHRGVLPHLMLTDQDVINAKTALLLDHHLNPGSSLTTLSSMRNEDMSLPIYTLRPGARWPSQKIMDAQEAPTVSPEMLELLPGLVGGYMIYRTGVKSRDAWELGGKYVKRSNGPQHKYTHGYFEAESWLGEQNLPLLYPYFKAPIADRFVDAFSDQRVVLPSGAIEFQERAKNLLSRQMGNAAQELAAADNSGGFATLIHQSAPAAMEVLAKALFEQHAQSFADDEDAQAMLHQYIQQDAQVARTRHPALKAFGDYSVSYALVCHRGTLEERRGYPESQAQLLTHIAMLASAALNEEHLRTIPSEIAAIAVAQWLNGLADLKDVQHIANELAGYELQLERQGQRIDRVQTDLATEDDRLSHARELGYLKVGIPVPLTRRVAEGAGVSA